MSCITEEQLKKINIIRLLLKYEIPVIERDKEYLISYYVQKLQIDLTESRGRVDGIDLERSFTLYSELEELYDIAKDLEKNKRICKEIL